MALFFDVAWFDARLEERGMTRATLGAVSGLSEREVALVFKDQREVSVAEVVVFAELLGASPQEVAEHAGVSTRAPRIDPLGDRLQAVEARLSALEAAMARLSKG
jgi:hypothetical protein